MKSNVMSESDSQVFLDCKNIIERIKAEKLANSTIIITGASGLIGGYLLFCLYLISKKIKSINVVAVYRTQLPDYILELEFLNLKHFKGDITDNHFCESLPMADFIVHAAGYGQPLLFMESPIKTLKLNTFSTFCLFDKLKVNGNFVFISSSEVYHGLTKKKFSENDIGITNTTHVRSCYIEGKRGGEAICNSYRLTGRNASSIRLAHTYGPGWKKGDKRVILSFIEKGMKGEIEMLDHGEVMRTYCYISDAIEIIWHVLFSCKEPIYNLCGESQISILSLAQKISYLMDVPLIIPNVKKSVSGAPLEVQLDMLKVKKEFGKTEFVSLDEGLKRTISWYTII